MAAAEMSKAELCLLIVRCGAALLLPTPARRLRYSRQLQSYNLESVASMVAEAAGVLAAFEPSPRLARLAQLGLREETGALIVSMTTLACTNGWFKGRVVRRTMPTRRASRCRQTLQLWRCLAGSLNKISTCSQVRSSLCSCASLI